MPLRSLAPTDRPQGRAHRRPAQVPRALQKRASDAAPRLWLTRPAHHRPTSVLQGPRARRQPPRRDRGALRRLGYQLIRELSPTRCAQPVALDVHRSQLAHPCCSVEKPVSPAKPATAPPPMVERAPPPPVHQPPPPQPVHQPPPPAHHPPPPQHFSPTPAPASHAAMPSIKVSLLSARKLKAADLNGALPAA